MDEDKKRKWQIVGAILFTTLLIVGLLWALESRVEEPIELAPQPIIGEKFIDYDIVSDKGTTVNFSSGKPMIVMFFASWCPYCNQGIDDFKTFTAEREDVNVTLINANAFEGSEKDAPKYIKDKDVDFPVIYDMDAKYTKAYGILAVPVNYLLDGDGVITDIVHGNISLENLEKAFPK